MYDVFKYKTEDKYQVQGEIQVAKSIFKKQFTTVFTHAQIDLYYSYVIFGEGKKTLGKECPSLPLTPMLTLIYANQFIT